MIALLALRSSSRWNCHSPSHQVAYASSDHDEREQHPAPAQQEPEPTQAGRGSGPHVATAPPRRRTLGWPMTLGRPRSTRFGRVATDLRVSLTDRCNLRCTYCMPAEGLDWLPDDEVLTDDEVVRLVTHRGRAARRPRGPVHRRRAAAAPRAASTSSAVRRRCAAAGDLAHHQRARARPARRDALAEAGLDRVNVSLDTVRPEDFHDDHPPRPARTTWSRASRPPPPPGSARSRSTRCCCAAINDDQAPELLRWCLERGYELRFIEQMPLDAQHGWSRESMVTADEIFASLAGRVPCSSRRRAAGQRAGRAVPRRRRPGHGRRDRLGHPAVLRRLRPGPAHRRRPGPQLPVRPRGVRPARPRCAAGATTTRSPTAGAPRCAGKRPGHGIDDPAFLQPARPMSAIGG